MYAFQESSYGIIILCYIQTFKKMIRILLVFASCTKQEGLEISSEHHIIKSLLKAFEEILCLNSKFRDSSTLNKKLGK